MSSEAQKGFFRRCTDWVTCRQVLNLMVLLGFMVNYMLRVNLTIAIVAMVVPANHSDLDSGQKNGTNDTGTIDSSTGGRYEWDAYLQNLILGCFFWGYICTELPGGRLAEIFGARRIFGYSTMCASILTLLTPLSCNISYIAVIILRVILGFMLVSIVKIICRGCRIGVRSPLNTHGLNHSLPPQIFFCVTFFYFILYGKFGRMTQISLKGATWPAIPPICSKWIPPLERSKFMSNMMASSLGAAVTMPVCGFLISSLGWESVFYVTGLVGLLWSTVWFLIVYDTPAQHPRISSEERAYIEESIGSTSNTGKPLSVPWKQILTSLPVWAIIITHGCSVFCYFTVVNQLPTFTKYILHYNIKANGLLSSLPYLGKYIFAVMTSYLADYLRQSNKLTTTTTRKLFTTFAVITPGLLMIVQVYQGYDKIASIAIFTLALTVNGGVTAGYLSNGLDIAPNFSGTIFGLANTLSSLGGFLSTLMVGTLTQDNQTYGQWQIVFWILSVTYIFGGLTFLFFGTGELQHWNSPNAAQPQEDFLNKDETIPLKNGTNNGKV